MAVEIQTIRPQTDVDCEALRRIGEKALQDEGRSGWLVSVTLVDDSFIQSLNRTYLHRDAPTDVLAFPIDEADDESAGGEKILGDVYVSLDRAHEQSREYEVPFEEELARLMLHGLFHLFGYSHEGMSPIVEGYLRKSRTVSHKHSPLTQTGGC